MGTGRLTHTCKVFTMAPAGFGLNLHKPPTPNDVAAVLIAVLKDIVGLLHEVAPHGYLIVGVSVESVSPQEAKLSVELLVSEADHSRVIAEWHPLQKPPNNPLQNA